MSSIETNYDGTSFVKYRAVVEFGNTIFQDGGAPTMPWWSLSKTVIAAAALALVKRGRLTLDDPVVGESYTLRQLLQHTSGLPDYGELPAYHQAVAEGITPWSRRELLDRVNSKLLRSTPGQRFAYSNVGYLIVRILIEETTGLDLADALHQLVFAPIGLDEIQVATQPSDLERNPFASAKGYHPGWVYHGLVVGTPAEAALFLSRLLGGDLLDAAMVNSMRSRFPIAERPRDGRPWSSAGYGLGLMMDVRSEAGPSYGHTGEGPGSTTATYWFETLPGRRTIAVFAGTSDPGRVEREVLQIARAGQLS